MSRKAFLAILFAVMLVLGTVPVEAWAQNLTVRALVDDVPCAFVWIRLREVEGPGQWTNWAWTDDEGYAYFELAMEEEWEAEYQADEGVTNPEPDVLNRIVGPFQPGQSYQEIELNDQ